MKRFFVAIGLLMLPTFLLATNWPEDSLKVSSKIVQQISQAQIVYQAVRDTIKLLQNDSLVWNGKVDSLRGGKVVPILQPDRVVYQKAGDSRGAMETFKKYQNVLKIICQQLIFYRERLADCILNTSKLAGWKDKDRVIECLENK